VIGVPFDQKTDLFRKKFRVEAFENVATYGYHEGSKAVGAIHSLEKLGTYIKGRRKGV
jgi:hypothetical protein